MTVVVSIVFLSGRRVDIWQWRYRHAELLLHMGEILIQGLEVPNEIQLQVQSIITDKVVLWIKVNPATDVLRRHPSLHKAVEIGEAGQMLFGPSPIHVVHPPLLEEAIGGVEAAPGVTHKSKLKILPELAGVGLLVLGVAQMTRTLAKQGPDHAGASCFRNVDKNTAVTISIAAKDASTP